MMARASRVSQSRAAESRESGMRKRPETHFQSKLYVPKDKIPSGMTYAWVRESTLNEPDPDNMTDRMIKGWAPVPASRHPEMVPPPLPGYEGLEVQVIRRGGLMLCECPRLGQLVCHAALISCEPYGLGAFALLVWRAALDRGNIRFTRHRWSSLAWG